jgi:hypothetical protein
VATLGNVDFYSDGSFFATHNPPSSFSTHPISNISNAGVGATGIYIHPKQSLPPMALKLVAPPGRYSDPFYHELLGIIAVGAWLTSGDTLARSYCTSAIHRFRQASNPTGAATRHLQYGSMLIYLTPLNGARRIRSERSPNTLGSQQMLVYTRQTLLQGTPLL